MNPTLTFPAFRVWPKKGTSKVPVAHFQALAFISKGGYLKHRKETGASGFKPWKLEQTRSVRSCRARSTPKQFPGNLKHIDLGLVRRGE